MGKRNIRDLAPFAMYMEGTGWTDHLITPALVWRTGGEGSVTWGNNGERRGRKGMKRKKTLGTLVCSSPTLWDFLNSIEDWSWCSGRVRDGDTTWTHRNIRVQWMLLKGLLAMGPPSVWGVWGESGGHYRLAHYARSLGKIAVFWLRLYYEIS